MHTAKVVNILIERTALLFFSIFFQRKNGFKNYILQKIKLHLLSESDV